MPPLPLKSDPPSKFKKVAALLKGVKAHGSGWIKSKSFWAGVFIGGVILIMGALKIVGVFFDHLWLVLGLIVSVIGLCGLAYRYWAEKRRREEDIRARQRQQEIGDRIKSENQIRPPGCDPAKWAEQQALNAHHLDLKNRLIGLNKNKQYEHKLTLWFKRGGMGLITAGVALIVAATIYDNSWLKIVGASSSVFAIGLFAFSFDHRTEERRLNDSIKQLLFECDLLQLSPEKGECRAEKTLGNNDSQLRSYYELNLEQCSKIFWVGILCLVAGVGVIAATLHAIKVSHNEKDTQIITGVVGAVGAVLINYVAAIFLKMHSEILTILKEFQSKLVDTQELYLANVLVSRITKQETQESALKALSLAMVQHEKVSKTTALEGDEDAKEAALNQYAVSVYRNARSGPTRK